MATEKKKGRWVDAISSMIELTQDGMLQWSVNANANTPYNTERTTSVFQTTYNDRALRLYEIKVPSNIADGVASFAYTIRGIEPPKWFTKIILEFIDSEGRALFTFPLVDALSDLLTSVQYQVAGVNEFLNDIIIEAKGLPRQDSAKAQKEMISEFNKRGDALSQIVKIAEDESINENERLQKVKALAFEAIFKPTF